MAWLGLARGRLIWVQILIILNIRCDCEYELLTEFLAATAPTNPRLRRSVRMAKCLPKETG